MLEMSNPNVQFNVVEMSTKGDEVLDRALYKIGDKSDFLSTHSGRWEQSPSNEKLGSATETLDKSNEVSESSSPSWSQQPRWVVDLSSVSDAENSAVVCESQLWSMKQCQQHHHTLLFHNQDNMKLAYPYHVWLQYY